MSASHSAKHHECEMTNVIRGRGRGRSLEIADFVKIYLILMLTGLHLTCIMAVDKHFFTVKLTNETTQRRLV